MAKRFALMGLAGYIAPRHLQAISETGNELIAAMDPNDSVGIIDSYFPDAAFFTEFERFDRHLELLRQRGEPIEYLTICTPNYLHDSHIRLALRLGAHAICEKPLVLEPKNIKRLQEVQKESGKKIYPILQLRVHPTILALREKFKDSNEKHEIDLTYVTPRGTWYYYSWKGIVDKSGGVVPNIGIHFFDMLTWIFGPVVNNEVYLKGGQEIKGMPADAEKRASGYIEFENAKVRWFLSVDENDLPESHDGTTWAHRSITIDGEEVEFSGGFKDLHTKMYERILADDAFTIEDAAAAVDISYQIRTKELDEPDEHKLHPFAQKYL